MTLRKIIKTKAITIPVTGTVKEAAKLMYKNHIGTVVVVDKSKKSKAIPIGIVTDRDIAIAYGKVPELASDYSIKKVMTSSVVMCSPEDGIYQTIVKMRQNGVRRMPVIDSNDELVGLIASDDILMLLGEELSDLSQIFSSEKMKESKTIEPQKRGTQLKAGSRANL
jgi:CBS domain-containing protein